MAEPNKIPSLEELEAPTLNKVPSLDELEGVKKKESSQGSSSVTRILSSDGGGSESGETPVENSLKYLHPQAEPHTPPTTQELNADMQKKALGGGIPKTLPDIAKITEDKGQLHQEAYTLATQGKPYASNAVADILLQKHPDDYYANQLKANNYLHTGEPEKAVAELDTAITKNPTLPALYSQRAAAKQRMGQDGTEDAQKYISAHPQGAQGNKGVANELANMYAIVGDAYNAKIWRDNYNELVKSEAQTGYAKTLQSFPDWYYSTSPITSPVLTTEKGLEELATAKNLPQAISGAMGVTFGTMGYVSPDLAAFNMVAGAMGTMLPEQVSQYVFAPVSTLLSTDKMGEWEKLGLQIGDLATLGLFLKGKDVLAKKLFNKEPITPVEAKEVSDAVADMKPEDIDGAAGKIQEFEQKKEAATQVSEAMKVSTDVPSYRIGEKLYTDRSAFLGDLAKAKERGASKVDWEVNLDPEAANEANEMFKPKVDEAKVEPQPEPALWTKEDAPEPAKERMDKGNTPTPEQSDYLNSTKKLINTDPQTGVKTYEVDGEYIRKNIYPDFNLGGNDMAYPNFIPKDEVWVEKDIVGDTKKSTIVHEVAEEKAMKEGMPYTDENGEGGAHGEGIKAEEAFREGTEPQQVTPEVGGKKKKIKTATEKVKSKKKGVQNAVTEGKVQEGNLQEHQGVSQGENVQENRPQVREEGSQQTGGGGGNEKGGEVQENVTSREARKQQLQQSLNDRLGRLANIKEAIGEDKKGDVIKDLAGAVWEAAQLGEIKLEEAIEQLIGKLPNVKQFMTDNREAILSEASKQGESMGIRHEATAKTREEMGIPPYEREGVTPGQIDAEADRLIRNGYNADALMQKMKDGYAPNKVEVAITKKYLADLYAKVQKDPSDANLSKLKSSIEAADIAGSEQSAAFRQRQGLFPVEESEATFMVDNMEKAGVDQLTPEQKEANIKEFNEISGANKQYKEQIAKLEEENAKLKAQKIFDEQRKANKKRKILTDEERAQKRERLLAIAGSNLEYFASKTGIIKTLAEVDKPDVASDLREAAKLINDLVIDQISRGAKTLEDAVNGAYDFLGGNVDKRVIRDSFSGYGRESTRPARSELAAKVSELRSLAKLTSKLEDLLRGEEPKTEKKRIEQNQKKAELRSQIKVIEARNKLGGVSDADLSDAKKLKSAITRMNNEVVKIEKQMKEPGILSKPEKKTPILENKELQKKFPDLYQKALDTKDLLIKKRHDREIRMLKEKYANRKLSEKAADWAIEVSSIPRTIMASMDLSATLRQGLWPTINHPMVAGRAFKEMMKQMKSQKDFDRWLQDVYDAPDYPVMKESGLYISDPRDPLLAAKEEQFMNNLAEKIPIAGKLIKGSERAYIAYLNKLRVDLFRQGAEQFEANGKTFFNNKKLYQELAKYINNSSGRGSLGELEGAAKYLNQVFFSPRLIASRMNMLIGYPLTLWKLPKEIRVQYLKDVARFVGFGTSVLALAKFSGAEVETDPRSSDFGKIKIGDTRYDIWGGFQPYVRVIAQSITQSSKSTTSGKVREFGSGYGQQTTADVWGRFLRGKLAPIPATALDFATGKTITGDKPTITNEVVQKVLPLITSDVSDAVQSGSVGNVAGTFLASTFGIGVQTYPATGWTPSQSVSFNGQKVNALGENPKDADNDIWGIMRENKVNVQPPLQTDMTTYNPETNKLDKYSDEQYFNYVKTRGNIIKQFVPQIINSVNENEAQSIQAIMNMKYNGQPLFKDEASAREALHKIILPSIINRMVSKAGDIGRMEATGERQNPPQIARDLLEYVNEYNAEHNR